MKKRPDRIISFKKKHPQVAEFIPQISSETSLMKASWHHTPVHFLQFSSSPSLKTCIDFPGLCYLDQ